LRGSLSDEEEGEGLGVYLIVYRTSITNYYLGLDLKN